MTGPLALPSLTLPVPQVKAPVKQPVKQAVTKKLPGLPPAPGAPKKTVKSGHCSQGHCEGTRPKSPSGVAFRTCAALDWCVCSCHAEWDALFAASGKERILITNPEYRPLERTWWMPDFDFRAENMAQATALKLEGETEPEFNQLESGRSARGQLEYRVKRAVEAWDKEEACTPKWISHWIMDNENVPAPSVGAVHSVLMRWEKIHYAVVERDPVRFVCLDAQGMKYGLDTLKARFELQKGKA